MIVKIVASVVLKIAFLFGFIDTVTLTSVLHDDNYIFRLEYKVAHSDIR